MAIESATVASTSVGTKNARQFQGLFDVIPFVCNIDEDSIAAGAQSAAVITVTGAKLGDFCLIGCEGASIDALGVSAQVTADDEVTVIFDNGDTGANTELSGNPKFRGLVLRLNDGIWDAL